ncbi:alkaline phosphatase [Caldicellulosiruptoraceae bacterium PP1]
MFNKKRIASIILIISIFFSFFMVSTFADETPESDSISVKNVIIMIPDGMTVAHTTLARWYQGGENLNMDELACGLIRTFSANNPITDSAPAATAMATGYKSNNKYLSVMPEVVSMPGVDKIEEKNISRPIATIFEAAKLKGLSTGIIATSNVQHATPAAFTSHTSDRNDYETIAKQQVFNNIDVVFGGGLKYLEKENRKDKEDLLDVLKQKGYEIITKASELKNIKGNKVWGLFANDAMKYDFDRKGTGEPSLAEMTSKAISILSKNKNGFILMVEGSKIDWASHANDPVGVVSDVLAFDKAVKVALDFAKKRNDTAIIIAPDHNNGGMSFGTNGASDLYLNSFLKYIQKATLTGEGVESKLNADKSNIASVVSQYYGIDNLTEDEIKAIKNAKQGSLNSVLGPIISKRSYIGWTTNEHTGEEVVLYSYHPNNYILKGVIDNTDIAWYINEILGLNLDEVNENMYVSNTELEEMGYSVDIDKSVPGSAKLIVKTQNHTLIADENKNIANIDGKEMKLKFVNVISFKKFYISKEILNYLK